MDISILPEAVHANLMVSSQEELFRELADPLVAAGKVKEDFAAHVLSREHSFPTGLPLDGFGVAIPHTDAEHVIAPAIAVATLGKPIGFKVMGDPDQTVQVSIVFMLALNEGHAHLEFLQKIIRLAQDSEGIGSLFSAQSDEELWQQVKARLE